MTEPSARLRAYLALERAVLDLDREEDDLADEIRDRMDPIWYALSPTEIARLDARRGVPADFAGTAGMIPGTVDEGQLREVRIPDRTERALPRYRSPEEKKAA